MRPAALAIGGLTIFALAAAGCGRRDQGAAPAAAVANTSAASFRAAGTEPFWALEITAGRLVFRTPEDTAGIRFPHAARTTLGDTLRWTDAQGARSIEARVWAGQCSDGMSDRAWTHRAVVRVDTLTYRGCADQT